MIRKNLVMSAFAASLAAGVLLLTPQTAAAASSEGARQEKLQGCTTDADGTFCYYSRLVYNEVVTPSGNYKSSGKSELIQTFTPSTPAGCNYAFSSQYKFEVHANIYEIEPQEARQVESVSQSFVCGGFSLICTTDIRAHVVQGRSQYFTHLNGCVRTP